MANGQFSITWGCNAKMDFECIITVFTLSRQYTQDHLCDTRLDDVSKRIQVGDDSIVFQLHSATQSYCENSTVKTQTMQCSQNMLISSNYAKLNCTLNREDSILDLSSVQFQQRNFFATSD